MWFRWFMCSIKKISYYYFLNYSIWSNFICVFIIFQYEKCLKYYIRIFLFFNCFLAISYFSFLTELVYRWSKCVSNESLSSGISHTFATLKYSIPSSFVVLRKVHCLFLYVNSCLEFVRSKSFFNLSKYLVSFFC